MSVKTWQSSRSHIDLENIKKNNNDFIKAKRSHINYINSYLQKLSNKNENYTIIEPGSGFGAGSYFLSTKNKNFNMTLLDYDDKLINDLKKVYIGNKQFTLIHGDMFNMQLKEKSYDFIYNAGVLEHFTFEERIKILGEYKKILKKDGYMFIIIPNHYNFVYKAFYIFANIIGRWRVAKEYSIYSFQKECNELGLDFIERKTFIENSIYGRLTLFVIKNS